MSKKLAIQLSCSFPNYDDLVKYLIKYHGNNTLDGFKQFIKNCYVEDLFVYENYLSNEVECVRKEYINSIIPICISDSPDGEKFDFVTTDDNGSFIL